MEAKSEGGGGGFGEVEWRRRSPSSSPEFEFWMLSNPSLPPTQLLSADELFVDGVLLPLHLLSHEPTDPIPAKDHPSRATTSAVEAADPSPAAISSAPKSPPVSSSKRWTDIFRVGSGDEEKEKEEKEKKKKKQKKKQQRREKKTGGGVVPVLVPAAEQININIWPFSRSRSTGNRPKSTISCGRKVSSAPCSRSNSGGGAGGRAWVSSPGRASGGIPVGRSSPIWRAQKKRNGGGGGGVGVLKLNVDSCIGHHRQQMGCGGESNGGHGSSSHFFSLRALFFSKKVY